ncbi:hypothetical protein L210DRAFT_2892476 [Boletus edulis BED1]|uniref:Uncharacterized protein n=1 Tax=Boletus edulis BED1 TaxID=1328754 RepID=A0AAD4BJI6_BOLED|nr:hypothetical protein L210DRAFT_2892476 [Boletus edulis BED1]
MLEHVEVSLPSVKPHVKPHQNESWPSKIPTDVETRLYILHSVQEGHESAGICRVLQQGGTCSDPIIARGEIEPQGGKLMGVLRLFLSRLLLNRHYDLVALFVAEGSPVPLHCHADYAKILSTLKILLQADEFAEAAQSPLTEESLILSALHTCFWLNDIIEQDFIDMKRRVIQVGYDPLGAISSADKLRCTAIQRVESPSRSPLHWYRHIPLLSKDYHDYERYEPRS